MLLCKEPPLDDKQENVRILNSLLRAGYGKREISEHLGNKYSLSDSYILIDWKRIKEEGPELKERVRNFGEKSYETVQQWLVIVENDYPDLLNTYIVGVPEGKLPKDLEDATELLELYYEHLKTKNFPETMNEFLIIELARSMFANMNHGEES